MILVTANKSSVLKAENINDPVTVTGVIRTEGTATEIGEAGYRIGNARVEIYEE